MIYVEQKTGYEDGDNFNINIIGVYQVNCDDVDERYKNFMINKAKNLGIVINPYWLNIMDKDLYHYDMSLKEYKRREKEWSHILNKITIGYFIIKILGGSKLKYKEIIDY